MPNLNQSMIVNRWVRFQKLNERFLIILCKWPSHYLFSRLKNLIGFLYNSASFTRTTNSTFRCPFSIFEISLWLIIPVSATCFCVRFASSLAFTSKEGSTSLCFECDTFAISIPKRNNTSLTLVCRFGISGNTEK